MGRQTARRAAKPTWSFERPDWSQDAAVDDDELPRVCIQEGSRGRELIVDGTLASLWDVGKATTGSVWDGLAAPLLFLPPEKRNRVLILGLGGGSVARVIRAIAPTASIIGVEMDQAVVDMANSQMGLDSLGVEVVVGDAFDFLKQADTLFDLIIDDVNVGYSKPNWIPEPAYELVAKCLNTDGVLVSNNFYDTTYDKVHDYLRANFDGMVQINFDGLSNSVLVASSEGLTAQNLRSAVRDSPVLAESSSGMSFADAPYPPETVFYGAAGNV